jgi:hypothetical protein
MNESQFEQIFKLLTGLNQNITTISEKLENLKPDKKKKLDKHAPLVVSIIALIFTIIFNYYLDIRSRKMQAFTTWNSFLSAAANNPVLANGIDTIRGKSIRFIANKDNRKNIDSATYADFCKYAWFVSYALSSAESVYDLQGSDKAWTNTLKEALGGHKSLFDAKVFDLNSYGCEFRKLLNESFSDKKIN